MSFHSEEILLTQISIVNTLYWVLCYLIANDEINSSEIILSSCYRDNDNKISAIFCAVLRITHDLCSRLSKKTRGLSKFSHVLLFSHSLVTAAICTSVIHLPSALVLFTSFSWSRKAYTRVKIARWREKGNLAIKFIPNDYHLISLHSRKYFDTHRASSLHK